MRLEFSNIVNWLKTHKISLLIYISLASIVILGIVLRLIPLQYGPNLQDYDPYVQFKNAEFVVNNGFGAFYNWFDLTRWAPWGTSVANSLGVGLAFTAAAIYFFLDFLGAHVSILTVVIFFPVLSGIVSILLVYGIGSSLVNRGVGLLAALVFALDPTSIQRTGIGFFTTEAGGLIGLFIAIFFFIKSLKSHTIPYSIIAGLGLSYMAICWGAYLYPLNLFALFLVVLTLMGKWNRNLATSFTIILGLTLFVLCITPSRGVESAISIGTVLPIMAFVVSIVQSFAVYIQDHSKRRKFSIGAVLGLAIIFVTAAALGLFGSLASKFLYILNPLSRIAIVGTVSEQQPSIWFNFFFDYHILIILAAVGAYFALRRAWTKDIFMVLFALAAIYGAGSQVRLLVAVAPTIAILAGFALTSIFKNLREMMKEKFDKRKGRTNFIDKTYAILILLIVVIAMFPIIYYNVPQSNTYPSIVDSASGYGITAPDWSQALAWMRDNTPTSATFCSWWDYGYWINVMGNKTVTSDNSTTNSTQIALTALAFLNNETVALPILEKMNVSYVVVFEPWVAYPNEGNSTVPEYAALPSWIGSGGDTAKSGAMVTIASAYSTEQGGPSYNISSYIQEKQIPYNGQTIQYPLPVGPDAHDSLLYQMLYQPWISGYSALGIKIDPLSQHFQLVFASSDYWVLIYKVTY